MCVCIYIYIHTCMYVCIYNPLCMYVCMYNPLCIQACLSGDGKALVLFALSPAQASAHESLCTLRFSSLISQCELGKATRHLAPAADREERADRTTPGGTGMGSYTAHAHAHTRARHVSGIRRARLPQALPCATCSLVADTRDAC